MLTISRKSQLDNLHLRNAISVTGPFEMPRLEPTLVVPTALVPFNVALSSKDFGQCVHFYIDDYQFERIWDRPSRYIEPLSRFQCVISPDFSQYIDMPYPQRLWNNYRGKFMGALMQAHGLDVIPNATWSWPDSYDYCFDGLPQGSVIAINSTGVSRHGFTRYLWLKGYREAIERLNPVAVIRYGNVVQGEDTSLGIYFNNDRIMRLRGHGR